MKQLNDFPDPHWDKFVEQCPQASFFHLSGWGRVIRQAYRHRTYYLYCENTQNGQIRGVLPLVHVRSVLFGSSLVSLPFCVYAGLAAMDSESAKQLIRAAKELAKQLNVGHLELRQYPQQFLPVQFGEGWLQPARYSTFIKAIPEGREAILAGVKYKQRAVVRKAINSPLTVNFENDMPTFYHLHATSVRDLGTPVFPRRYFSLLQEVFGRRCDILILRDRRNNTPVSAVLSFYFRDQVLPYYAGQIASQARALKANDRMYFELMCAASDRGYRQFDFGRSKNNTGAYNYKRHWGFDPVPLAYQYCLIRASSLPENNPNNPKYQQFIRLWKKLPLPVSQLVGPGLAKSLG